MKKIKTEKKERKSIGKTILIVVLALFSALITLGLSFALYIVITSPNFETEELYQIEPTILYDKYGVEFARVGQEDSTIVKYEELPDVLIDALIATEDSRFFQHNGIDLFRFLKASAKTLVGSDDAGGASTLSMQVIKNTYTKKDKKETNKIEMFVRKFRDIYMAVFKLERKYTKEEIIEFYLNSQWFANSSNINTSGIMGVERASQYYFGKSVKDINLAEATLMAGMFQNPYRYNPYRNPEGCRNRQKTVLKLLVRHGYITEEQQQSVLNIPISSMLIEKQNSSMQIENNQAFVDYVIAEVSEDLGINARQASLKIYTTFDPKVQKILEDVENGVAYTYLDDTVQEGIAVTSTVDGSITALSGGRGYTAMGLNRATDIQRQPGSTAKPIMDYAMYIEHISHSSYGMFLDEPTTYSNGTKITNYDNGYKGLITMRFALKDSRNIPALLAFQAVYKKDPEIIKNFAHSVGIDYGKDLVEAASIGGFDKGASPLQMSAAYASFARGGYYIEPYAYTKVINTMTGEEITNSYTKKQVMDETTAFMINNILIEAYGGKGVSGTQIAGKTGTTNLNSDTKKKYGLPNGAVMDAWIMSYSPSYSIGLWLGYDELSSDSAAKKYYLTSNTGGTARRRIMNYLASNIHEKNQKFSTPKGITTSKVELQSFPAQLCSESTPADMCVSEYFVKGMEPTERSKRFANLDNPKNPTASIVGSTVTLKWDAISTPEAIDPNYLSQYFSDYFGKSASKYYDNRLEYNSSYIGTIGYDIYLKIAGGAENYLGFTNNNSFIYTLPASGKYEFIIKSAYSIFKDNRSSGVSVSVEAVDTTPIVPTDDQAKPNPNTTNDSTGDLGN